MARITLSCGNGPALGCSMKRSMSRVSRSRRGRREPRTASRRPGRSFLRAPSPRVDYFAAIRCSDVARYTSVAATAIEPE